MELVAQGVANIVTPLFGGIPATGAIARTATNIRNGGRTPVAGIIHSLTLLIITLFFGRYAGFIPFATLAAILVVVAYHMSEWRRFRAEFSAPRSDLLVLLTTFTLTVAVDLVVAIEVGMVLAAFLFMGRMAEVTDIHAITDELNDPGARGGGRGGRAGQADSGDGDAGGSAVRDLHSPRRNAIPDGIEVYEINGPFFFGAAASFRETVSEIDKGLKVLIIRMRNVPAIDSTGMHALGELIAKSNRDGVRVMLSEAHAQPLVALGRSDLLDRIGEANLFGSLDEALDAARAHLASLPVKAKRRS
jgi:SulP family sulfate permease